MAEQEIAVVEEINQALVKENVTDTVIARLRTDYMGLTIAGRDDKEGYNIVKTARIECRDLRVLAVRIAKKGREKANAVSKAWIAKEKEVVAQIEEVENYLSSQEEAIDALVEAEKAEEKRKKDEWAQTRIDKLAQYGEKADLFVITDMPDDIFEDRVAKAKINWEAEQLRISDEETKKEEDRKAQEALAESNKQEAIRLETIKQEQAKKDEALAEERRQFEADKKAEEDRKAEEARVEAKRLQDIEDQKKREAEAVAAAEARELKRQEEAARLAALAPDKEKLAAYAEELMAVRCLELATDDAKVMLKEAVELLAKVIVILKQ